MKFLFYLGHPAHFHLFKNVIHQLGQRGHETKILIKKKDVLERLLIDSGWDYINILPQGRKDDRLSIALGLLKRDRALWNFTRDWRPDLLAGTSAEIAHVGRLRGIPTIVVNEDDWDVVPLFSNLAYPFCTWILIPDCCRVGRWQGKTIQYAGYHELAYLHPHYFTPDREKVTPLFGDGSHYFILRFAQLTAHHDRGVSGLPTGLVETIIGLLRPYGSIHITSERPLEPQFEPYRIHLAPLDMHHALAFADLYIGDSQTMTAEAAVLGTPALRFNDFVGRINYLEELEQRYQLTHGFCTDQPTALLRKVESILNQPERVAVWQERRTRMLQDKIDVAEWMVKLFEQKAAEGS